MPFALVGYNKETTPTFCIIDKIKGREALFEKFLSSGKDRIKEKLTIICFMLTKIPFLISFFSGMILEILLTLAFTLKEDRIRLAGLPMMALLLYGISVLYMPDQGDYTLLLVSACLFVFGTSLLFIAELLPSITRYHVLSYTVIFWYVYMAAHSGPSASEINLMLLPLFATGTAAAVYALWPGGASPKALKASYAWYLAILAYIGAAQYQGLNLGYFSGSASAVSMPAAAESFVYGMGFTFVISSFSMVYFFVFLSMPQEKQKERWRPGIKKLLETKVLDVVLAKPDGVFKIVGAQLALSAVNYSLNLVPHFFFVNCCLLVMPIILSYQVKASAAIPRFVFSADKK